MKISPHTFFLSFGQKRKEAGFTFTELMVILLMISFFMLIVMTSITKSRASGRDSQVRADRQNLKLAFARVAQFNPGGKYPGTAGTWYCLKTSTANGTSCARGSITGVLDNVVFNPIMIPSGQPSAYLSGGEYPTPPKSIVNNPAYDSYMYTPSDPTRIPGYNGALLLWWQEKAISSADCPNPPSNPVAFGDNGIYYYCFEKLQ